MATRQLEIYFDYISPFAYMAAELLGPLAARHGAELIWKPIEFLQLPSFGGGSSYTPAKRLRPAAAGTTAASLLDFARRDRGWDSEAVSGSSAMSDSIS